MVTVSRVEVDVADDDAALVVPFAATTNRNMGSNTVKLNMLQAS